MVDHELRRKTLGASESPIVLGLSPWSSPYEVWAIKRGLISPEQEDVTGRLEAGQRAEQMVAEWYAKERFGDRAMVVQYPQGEPEMQIVRYPQGDPAVNELYPWLSATPDYYHDDLRSSMPEGWLLEIKTASEFTKEAWEDGPPDHYLAQVQHQMLVLGAERCTIAVMIGFTRPQWWDIKADPEFQKLIIEKTREFWDLVESGTPPPTDGSQATLSTLRRMHPEDNGQVVKMSDWAFRARRDELAAQIAGLEAELSGVNAAIMEELGGATFGVWNDGSAVSWKTQRRKGDSGKSIRVLRFLKRLPKGVELL